MAASPHILDTVAAMVSGSTLPPGKHATGFARDYGGPATCAVVASDVLHGPSVSAPL